MKRIDRPSRIAVSLALVALAACSPGEKSASTPPAVGSGAPVALFESTVHDAGRVEQGSPIRHEFRVTNTGDAPLTLDAQANCGCTITEVDKVVAPGATAKVTASLDTGHAKGKIAKAITVTTNDPAQSRISLEIRADVAVPIDVRPERAFLSTFSGKRGKIQVDLVASDGTPFEISKVLEIPCLEASWKDGPTAASKSVEIEADADCPSGRFWHEVEVATSHPRAAIVPFKLIVHVRSETTVTPDNVVIWPAPPEKEFAQPQQLTASVRISRQDGKKLGIASVTPSDPRLQTELRTIEAGREYVLEINYTGPPERKQGKAEIVVVLDSPRAEKIIIPVIYAI